MLGGGAGGSYEELKKKEIPLKNANWGGGRKWRYLLNSKRYRAFRRQNKTAGVEKSKSFVFRWSREGGRVVALKDGYWSRLS